MIRSEPIWADLCRNNEARNQKPVNVPKRADRGRSVPTRKERPGQRADLGQFVPICAVIPEASKSVCRFEPKRADMGRSGPFCRFVPFLTL